MPPKQQHQSTEGITYTMYNIDFGTTAAFGALQMSLIIIIIIIIINI